MNRNRKLLYPVLIITLLLIAILSLSLGAERINIVKAIGDISNGIQTADSRILQFARIPRTLAGILAGCALGASGAMIQSVLANSLASPSTIGVNSGAGLAVAIFAAIFPEAVMLVPLASLAGAFLGALLVLSIGERTSSSRMGLVLAGVAVSAIFSAGIDTVLTFVPDALSGYSDFRIGGLSGISMKDLFPAAPIIIIALLISLMLHNEMDILQLGMDESRTLGLPAKQLRMLFLALAAAMAGSAISFSGLIGFVGLIVPHIMREFVGEESGPLIITSSLGGAILLMGSDLLSRLAFAPFELPVGILMALIGGPFFIYLLRKRGRAHD